MVNQGEVEWAEGEVVYEGIKREACEVIKSMG